jgi:DNA damage-binding protein 1
VLTKYALPSREIVESMTIATFKEYPNQEYLFVGTTIENIEDPDSSSGRILIFDVKETTHIELIKAIELPGVIYTLKSFQNSVVATANGSVSYTYDIYVFSNVIIRSIV